MTSKEMAKIAWENMQSFDWALQKNHTINKFEQYVIDDAVEVLNLKQIKSYIEELKKYAPMRNFMLQEINEEGLKQEIYSRIKYSRKLEAERKAELKMLRG